MSRSFTEVVAPSLADAQNAGFPVGGEPLAVDLADTVVTVVQPPIDLIADVQSSNRFWELQSPRLPEGWRAPSLQATLELRDAVRDVFDAVQARRRITKRSLNVINDASASASRSNQIIVIKQNVVRVEHWITDDPSTLALAAAALSAITILTDSSSVEKLRRCANPACSMLFYNGDSRRQWCTPNICGNRARVARHYRRHRSAQVEAISSEALTKQNRNE